MPEPMNDELRAGSTKVVTIDINGRDFPIRYTIASMKRLKLKLGRPMFGTAGALNNLDEDNISEIIFEGLKGPKGEAPDGVTLDDIEAEGVGLFGYFTAKFWEAYAESIPEKKQTPAQKKTLALLMGRLEAIEPTMKT